MARGRHYVRAGTGDADRRELQSNGGARAVGPWHNAHASFADPWLITTPGAMGGWTGFAADGWWYQNGRRVGAGLGEQFGFREHNLNRHKWAVGTALAMPWVQSDAALRLLPGAGASSHFQLRARRWTMRGDFCLRLKISGGAPAVGSGPNQAEDNAVWLGVTNADGSTWCRSKRARTDAWDGFSAEVSGGGPHLGAVADPGRASYTLVVRRVAGTLYLEAVTDAATHALFVGAVPGIAHIEIGARHVGGDAWTADLVSLEHVSGWHDYSPIASWASETARGVIFDEFEGDAADPALWTAAVAGGGTLGIDNGVEMTLAGVGDAELVGPAVTGDFTARIAWVFEAFFHQITEGFRDSLGVLEVRAERTGWPRLRLEIALDVHPGALLRRLLVRWVRQAAAMDPDELIAVSENLPADAGDRAFELEIERRGYHWYARATDRRDGATLLDAHLGEDFPSHPARVVLASRTNNPLADYQAIARRFRLRSPHGLVVDTWPTNYYVAAARADAEEVLRVAGVAVDPIVCETTVIDVVQRIPVWRIVGAADGNDPDPPPGDPGFGLPVGAFAQALPGGDVGWPWPDPDGVLWLPVGQRDVSDPGDGFVAVDLRLDEIRRYRDGTSTVFGGPVAWRHLGLGYGAPVSTGPNGPPSGTPLRVERHRREPDDDKAAVTLWATSHAVRAYEDFVGLASDLMADADPGAHGTTEVLGFAALPPVAPGASLDLCVLATRRDDTTVAVYRDVGDIVASGVSEVVPGDAAAARYTGSGPHPLNGDLTAGKLVGLANNDTYDLDALRGTDDAPLFAVARKAGVAAVQHVAVPADAPTAHWPVTVEDAPGDTELAHPALGVRLSPDAHMVTPAGWIFAAEAGWWSMGGELDLYFGRVEVASLATMRVRTRLTPAEAYPAELVAVTDPRSSPAGLLLISPPPGAQGGWRVAWGLRSHKAGIVEYDVLSVGGGPWRGPHIGGTELQIVGHGLDSVARVTVGGVDCFRLAYDTSTDPPGLAAVNRALGWIEHEHTPVMADEELEATAEWPHDVALVFSDGAAVSLPGAFTYESVLCIEYTLRRLLARFRAPRLIEQDPKVDTAQRTVLVPLAWLICRWRSAWQIPLLDRDTHRATAEGIGLDAVAEHFAAGATYEGMTDEQRRAYVLARGLNCRPTRKAILDVAEAILGVRPTMEEGWRWFTLHATLPLLAVVQQNFFADALDADLLSGGYRDRDFWGGDDPRIEAARRAIDHCRAAGVRGSIVQED